MQVFTFGAEIAACLQCFFGGGVAEWALDHHCAETRTEAVDAAVESGREFDEAAVERALAGVAPEKGNLGPVLCVCALSSEH
jgi:hypothetical protein